MSIAVSMWSCRSADRPSTYHQRAAQRRDPSRLSPRAQRDEAMKVANLKVYGVRKVWRQMQREGFDIARCTMERLMRDLSLQGVIQGKSPARTAAYDCDARSAKF